MSRKKNDLFLKEVEFYLRTLFPINRSITGEGVRKTINILKGITNFNTIEIPSGKKCFDWKIPPEWVIHEGYLEDLSGTKLIDYKNNNLHVLNYSDRVDKICTFEELKEHLFYLPQMPNAIPYKTAYYKKNWGFCLSYNQFKKLNKHSKYHVKINSELIKGSITLGEAIIKGTTDTEILISSYSCHPSLANDNLSGILLWALLLRELKKSKPRYTYRFVLLPETIGAIAYMHLIGKKVKNIIGCYNLTTVAGPGQFGYKFSFLKDSLIDRIVLNVFFEKQIKIIEYPFDISGSDERQYQSQGFRIPTGTITKDKYYEYKEYHTSLDNLDFIKASYLKESFNLYLNVFSNLEKNKRFKSLMTNCEPMLSKRDLFPGIGVTISNHIEAIDIMHKAKEYSISEQNGIVGQDIDAILWLMFYCDGEMTLLDISERSNISITVLYKNANILVKKKLLRGINE